MTKKLYRLRYKDVKTNIVLEDGVVAENVLEAYQIGLRFAKQYGLLLLRVELMFSYRERRGKDKTTLLTYTRT